MRKPLEFDNYPDNLTAMAPYGPYKAVCSRIVDGDTAYFLVSPGFDAYVYAVIRVLGINAPELNTGNDRVAGAAARDYLAQLMPPGSPVLLSTERDVTTFGRYVAAITLADLRDVGIEMLTAGHAVPMRPDGSV